MTREELTESIIAKVMKKLASRDHRVVAAKKAGYGMKALIRKKGVMGAEAHVRKMRAARGKPLTQLKLSRPLG